MTKNKKIAVGVVLATSLALSGTGCFGKTPTAHTHDFGEWKTTAATCESDGEKVRTCKGDSTHQEKVVLPKLDHDWDNGVVTTKATCTEEGQRQKTCSYNSTHIKKIAIDAIGHNFGEWTTTSTCFVAGEKTRVCKNDANHTEKLTDPAHHEWSEWTTTATCEEAGVKTRICKRDSSHIEHIDEGALGHSYSTKTQAATCTEDGWSKEVCSRNSSHVKNETVLSKLGHDYGDWVGWDATDRGGEKIRNKTCKHDSSHVEQEIMTDLDRRSCATDNGFNYDVQNTDNGHRKMGNIEIGTLIMSGAKAINGSSPTYKLDSDKAPAVQFKVSHNVEDLPRSSYSEAFKVNNQSYSGKVKDTNIGGKKLGVGAYYVKITYTDGDSTEYNKTNFLNGATKDTFINLVDETKLNNNKTLKKIDVVIVYEIYRGSPGDWFGIWWHEYTDWSLTHTYNFQ